VNVWYLKHFHDIADDADADADAHADDADANADAKYESAFLYIQCTKINHNYTCNVKSLHLMANSVESQKVSSNHNFKCQKK